MLAPFAVSVVELPEHIDGDAGVTMITAFEFTDTVTVAVLVHPADVPVTVYTIVEPGVDVTVAPVVALSAVLGDHV